MLYARDMRSWLYKKVRATHLEQWGTEPHGWFKSLSTQILSQNDLVYSSFLFLQPICVYEKSSSSGLLCCVFQHELTSRVFNLWNNTACNCFGIHRTYYNILSAILVFKLFFLCMHTYSLCTWQTLSCGILK